MARVTTSLSATPNRRASLHIMRHSLVSVVAAVSFLYASALAQTPLHVIPTTASADETGNNTSAANTFQGQSNGNIGPGNISKVPLSTLLNGASTPMYAHLMPWFGSLGHLDIGYDSADPAQVARQVDDMMSRGLKGAIVDWYGPNNTHHNTATINLMREAEKRAGNFQFAVQEDGGALRDCNSTPGCDQTTQLISDLTYAYNTFESSPAYLRIQGRPLVMFFNPERFAFYDVAQYNIDWNKAAASIPGNPLFIFADSKGFTHSASGGSFAWVHITRTDPQDWQLDYLNRFYGNAQLYSSEAAFGGVYKGFNDTIAGWSENRIMNQNCGQTWLRTFGEINSLFPTGNLPFLHLVTWNDYEEGTELESGIQNCAVVTASLSQRTLAWQLTTGDESTIDHYQIFVSLDGTNLMPLAQAPAGVHSLDLSSYTLAGGYRFLVKAIGKPSIRNQMSK